LEKLKARDHLENQGIDNNIKIGLLVVHIDEVRMYL
jgi:hypothetical protein